MLAPTQEHNRNLQTHKTHNNAWHHSLQFCVAFVNKNLKSVFSYLFIFVSSQNFSVRFLQFSIAMFTLPNHEIAK